MFKKLNTKTLKTLAVTLIAALVASIGLDKVLALAGGQSDVVQKISAIATTGAGAAAQMSKSDLVKVVGVVALAKGATATIQSFTTDSIGNPKTDAVSRTLQAAIQPEGGLNGLKGMFGLKGLPNPSVFQGSGMGNPALIEAKPFNPIAARAL